MQANDRQYPRAGILSCVALSAALAGCAPTAFLEPASTAQTPAAVGGGALASTAGVTVTVIPGAWHGTVDIEEALVPLKVRLQNDSGRKLDIRYSNFWLITEFGDRFAALPPYRVEGVAAEPLATTAYAPIAHPGITHSGFWVAVHYGDIYTTLPPYTLHDLYYNPVYYSYYFPYWGQSPAPVELPTAEMLRLVVPEGVLDDSGELEGFLYFQDVPERLADSRIDFHMDLMDAIRGERFATLRIPFDLVVE